VAPHELALMRGYSAESLSLTKLKETTRLSTFKWILLTEERQLRAPLSSAPLFLSTPGDTVVVRNINEPISDLSPAQLRALESAEKAAVAALGPAFTGGGLFGSGGASGGFFRYAPTGMSMLSYSRTGATFGGGGEKEKALKIMSHKARLAAAEAAEKGKKDKADKAAAAAAATCAAGAGAGAGTGATGSNHAPSLSAKPKSD
jgi:hypothetical protein